MTTTFLFMFTGFLCDIYAQCTSMCLDGPEWISLKDSHLPAVFTPDQMKNLCHTDMNVINKHLDNILVSRTVGSQGHDDVLQYISNVLADAGYSVNRHEFTSDTTLGPKTFTNIIATFDQSAKRRLILACHYDSKLFYEFNFLGATDSALPCALLLDTALTLRPYLQSRELQDLTLELVFFDGEEAFVQWTDEDSLYGARELSRVWNLELYPPNNEHNTKRLDQIDVLVLLDLLGTAQGTVYNYPQNVGTLYQTFPQIEQELKQLGCLQSRIRPSFSFDMLNVGREGIQDDHIPFLRKSVRVVHVIPYPFPREWHKESDNRSILDSNSIYNMASIVRIFVAKYLHLEIPSSA